MAKDSKPSKPPVERWAIPPSERKRELDPRTDVGEVDFSGPPKGKPKKVLRVDPDRPPHRTLSEAEKRRILDERPITDEVVKNIDETRGRFAKMTPEERHRPPIKKRGKENSDPT